ncbi:hypothetical protein C6P46_000250 [Rhodotorula mucilaginosa]|uniref:Uncharacterized protein n=1 Tax=Rhodotorula mucilaginosa TaxID=5537 RepID=A0A9P6W8J6_RHOMI|nr:hypothetical protein C6P46_000250 [Rhodotorula mucilaginosa]TKA52153.1 hypothetical protein B0A53_04997 [Rhodotorula sp. CCFEE 5036]
MPRQYDTSEPRRAGLAKPYKYEYESSDTVLPDLAALLSMLASGAAMITRFTIWPWIALVFAISSVLANKSLGTNKKTGETGGLISGSTALMFASTAFFSIYMPLLTLQAEKAGSPTWPFGINKGLRVIPQAPFVRPDVAQ